MPAAAERRVSQGARDVAAALFFVALVLFMPPIILIAAVPGGFAGVPYILIYIFGAWAAINLAAFLVARRLAREAQAGAGEEEDGIGDRLTDMS